MLYNHLRVFPFAVATTYLLSNVHSVKMVHLYVLLLYLCNLNCLTALKGTLYDTTMLTSRFSDLL